MIERETGGDESHQAGDEPYVNIGYESLSLLDDTCRRWTIKSVKNIINRAIHRQRGGC